MHLSTRLLGANIVHGLAEKAGAAVLTIGSDRFRRRDLAGIGCFNFQAAARLTEACKALGAKSTRDLFEHYPPSALVLPGVGAIALAVLGAAFEVRKLGGEAPLESWALRHRAKDASREFVTFHTLKVQEAHREAGEARAKKQRKARHGARRDQAQQLRVGRFTSRQTGSATHAATN